MTTDTTTEAVPVPPCPPGAVERPGGVLPGELARWSLGDGEFSLILGMRRNQPWVAILGGLGGGPLIERPDRLGQAADMLRVAHRWMTITASEYASNTTVDEVGQADNEIEQPTLFDEAPAFEVTP